MNPHVCVEQRSDGVLIANRDEAVGFIRVEVVRVVAFARDVGVLRLHQAGLQRQNDRQGFEDELPAAIVLREEAAGGCPDFRLEQRDADIGELAEVEGILLIDDGVAVHLNVGRKAELLRDCTYGDSAVDSRPHVRKLQGPAAGDAL